MLELGLVMQGTYTHVPAVCPLTIVKWSWTARLMKMLAVSYERLLLWQRQRCRYGVLPLSKAMVDTAKHSLGRV